MSERTRPIARVVAVLATVSMFVMLLAMSSGGATDSHAERPTRGRVDQPTVTFGPDDAASIPGLSAALAERDATAVADLAVAIDRQQVADYIVAVAVQEYADAVARSRPVIQQAPLASSPSTYSGTGSCYGGPIPDYIVNRESGGNPYAQNPSGAFGCFQIMPEWWSGACSSMDRMTIDGQKACAAILWNGGAGASNWAATV